MKETKKHHLLIKHYAKYIASLVGIVLIPFSLQVHFVYHSFEWIYLVAPIVVGVVFGLFFGNLVHLRRQLSTHSHLFTSLVEFSSAFAYIQSLDGVYQYASPAAFAVTGYEQLHFLQNPGFWNQLVHKEDLVRWEVFEEACSLEESLEEQSINLRIWTQKGSLRWIEHRRAKIKNKDGKIVGYRAINRDISELKKNEERIQRMANFDPLTGLPNRRYLMDKLRETIATSKLEEVGFSVHFLDLDRFKYINDTFGHAFGDQLLRKVAQKLTNKGFCKNVEPFVGRFGGDEFVIILPDEHSFITRKEYIEALLHSLKEPFLIGDTPIYIGATVGVSLYPEDGQTAEELIKYSDVAMYAAKKQIQSRFCFFSKKLHQSSENFFSMEQGLRDALQEKKILAHYQPQFDIQTKNLIGVEALARWTREDGTKISPLEFIPVAEETGLILQLGEQIIEQSVGIVQKWEAQGLQLKMAINVSAMQLQAHAQYKLLLAQIRKSGVSLHNIEVEVTEGILLEQTNQQIESLKMLGDAGITIAIDDFGTGYSSLGYLRSMPTQILKIDRLFVSNMLSSPADRALVESIVSIAHHFDMKTVAEGVETEAEVEFLSSIGCDYGQGYWYAKPMDSKALSVFIAQKIASNAITSPRPVV